MGAAAKHLKRLIANPNIKGSDFLGNEAGTISSKIGAITG